MGSPDKVEMGCVQERPYVQLYMYMWCIHVYKVTESVWLHLPCYISLLAYG